MKIAKSLATDTRLALLALGLAVTLSWVPAWTAAPVTLTLKGSWPGHARGLAQDLAVQGRYAFVAAGEGGLLAVDVSDPAHLVVVGGCDTGGSARRVTISGHYAFVADLVEGLRIIDIRDPAKPQQVGDYGIGGYAWDVAVSGYYAYVANGDAGLKVIDISDLGTPAPAGVAAVQDATAVVVSDHYAFVAKDAQWDGATGRYVGGWGLRIVDVSDPTHPVVVGGFETAAKVAGVAVSGAHAYLAEQSLETPQGSSGGGLHVLDIRDPSHPVRVSGLDDLNASTVSVAGDRAYLGVRRSARNATTGGPLGGGLLLVDVHDPAAPVVVGRYDSPPEVAFQPNVVDMSGSVALLIDSTPGFWSYPEGEGLIALDVGDPSRPVRLGTFTTDGYFSDVKISGNHAYVPDALGAVVVFDVGDPGAPERIASYQPAESYAYYVHLAMVGDVACVNGFGLELLDTSDPIHPRRLSRTDAPTYGDMVASGSYLYGTDWDDGLAITDVRDPAHPVIVGRYQGNTGKVSGVAVSGNLAYVVDSDYSFLSSPAGNIEHHAGSGLVVLDVSDPRRPVRVGSAGSFGGRAVVAVSGRYAYVASYIDPMQGGLGVFQAFDVGNPARPLRIGELGNIDSPERVAVSDHYVYLLTGWFGSEPEYKRGLLVLDVSDPTQPVRVGFHEPVDWGGGFAVAGSRIYVVDHRHGLQILETSVAPSAAWFQVAIAPSAAPPARAFHGLVYDTVHRLILMHGGMAGPGSPSMTDTWAWDGASWKRLTQQGPATWGFGFAFDSDRGVAVLHGGWGTGSPRPTLGATWEWNGQAWRQVSDRAGPGIRGSSAMAYDPVRKRVVLHGGTLDIEGNTILSDTWAWDGSSWQEIPNANGPRRTTHQMVYDERRQVMVFFGGLDARGSGPADTWVFDGTQWHLAATNGPPGGREFPILGYDPLHGVTILTSGGEWKVDGFPAWKYFNDTWEWNGSQWTKLTPEGTLPPAVQASAGAFDSRRGRLVLFGGSPNAEIAVLSNKTWEYGLPELRLIAMESKSDGSAELRWTGGAPPYQLQGRGVVDVGDWEDVGAPTAQTSATLPLEGKARFLRVLSRPKP